ncbi:hypothetical protein CGCTS75_v006319 [Colletotrichum tropicale]|nr:hypothetical protein CGCTS75_v006319 [Colletotrichum tropicale]
MKANLIAAALANAAIVLGGVYKGYICVMSNGAQNPSDNICWQAYGTPLPGSPGVVRSCPPFTHKCKQITLTRCSAVFRTQSPNRVLMMAVSITVARLGFLRIVEVSPCS